MARLADLQARMRGLGDLREVVGAMRSLSAVRVRQAHGALEAIREYDAIIAGALSQVAASFPVRSPSAPSADVATAVVVFGSEHGFVGSFNERILDVGAKQLRGKSDRLLVVGSRAAAVATDRRCPVAWTCAMASHIGAVESVTLDTAEQIARAGGDSLGSVVLVYTRASAGASGRPVAERLVPDDLGANPPIEPVGLAPLSNLAPRVLFDRLLGEVVVARLARVVMESFASENAARLAVMESAHGNIDDKLTALERLEHEGRQEEITTELLDIVAGTEATRVD